MKGLLAVVFATLAVSLPAMARIERVRITHIGTYRNQAVIVRLDRWFERWFVQVEERCSNLPQYLGFVIQADFKRSPTSKDAALIVPQEYGSDKCLVKFTRRLEDR